MFDCSKYTSVFLFLLRKEEGGIFSALGEGDRKEPQCDIPLSGTGCELFGL